MDMKITDVKATALRTHSVFVQVFTPLNSGLAESDTYAEAAREILEGVTISGVHFRGVLTNEIGPTGKWFQVTVEAPFTYYIQK